MIQYFITLCVCNKNSGSFLSDWLQTNVNLKHYIPQKLLNEWNYIIEQQ